MGVKRQRYFVFRADMIQQLELLKAHCTTF